MDQGRSNAVHLMLHPMACNVHLPGLPLVVCLLGSQRSRRLGDPVLLNASASPAGIDEGPYQMPC